MDMRDTVLSIIDCLEDESTARIRVGLDDLDELLQQLVPYIRAWRQNPNGIKHPKLVQFESLQDLFESNITNALLLVYNYLLRHLDDASTPLRVYFPMILTANRLLQGILLIHPNSRNIISRAKNMKLILSFLQLPHDSSGQEDIFNEEDGNHTDEDDDHNNKNKERNHNRKISGSSSHSNGNTNSISIEVSISFISLLIHILLKNLQNFRVFEDNDGCAIVIRKLELTTSISDTQPTSSPSLPNKIFNQQDLNFKIIEFLVFYLIDETEIFPHQNNTHNKLKIRSLKEKAEFFRPEFLGIDDLIEHLNHLKNL